MINVKIMGGLGNQLFQWACARNLQEKYGHFIKYDLGFYNNQSLRRPQFNEFKYLQFNTVEIQPAFRDIGVCDLFSYHNFNTKNLSDLSVRYHLHGYWQSEKYFEENAAIIKQNLEIDPHIEYYIEDNYPFIKSEKTVSLHVRRTDYVSSNGYHPVQPLSYYQQALDLLTYDKILVFSDDIEWCKQNLKFKNIVFSEGNSNIQDLYLMSMCQHNVIANSTFSWWAAWLNKNPSKKIIAPEKWLGPKGPSYDDIVPEGWIKI